MMKMKTKTTEMNRSSDGKDELEVRPGGMLVQKRDPDELQNRIPPPTIRVRVKYGSIYHQIIINSTATFGELKKMLTGPTGLHHEDQKLIYKDKERSSKSFLDVVGVKDRSKMVLLEDPVSRERRLIEARKAAKIEKTGKMIANISLEVDRLAGQVSALESVILKGGKVADKMVSDLIELLMNQLLKLDEIKIDGDLNQQKNIQVEKVQRNVEKLDVLKVKNSKPPLHPASKSQSRVSGTSGAQNQHSRRSEGKSVKSVKSVPVQVPIGVKGEELEGSGKKTAGGVVVTTQWETFDSLPTVFSAPQMSTSTSITSETIQHNNFNWDLLLK